MKKSIIIIILASFFCSSAFSQTTKKNTNSKTFDLREAVTATSKTVNLLPSIKDASADMYDRGYSITLKYNSDVPAQQDTYLFTVAFVKYLVSVGRDPSNEKARRSVNVCAEQVGLFTVTGKPGVKMLGCSHYNPYNDQITEE